VKSRHMRLFRRPSNPRLGSEDVYAAYSTTNFLNQASYRIETNQLEHVLGMSTRFRTPLYSKVRQFGIDQTRRIRRPYEGSYEIEDCSGRLTRRVTYRYGHLLDQARGRGSSEKRGKRVDGGM
jgi:hypothetical protein